LQLSMKARKNKLFIGRIGLCWEATRAPRWTRKPQAWAISVAQAGLLRVRSQSEKSTFKLTSKKPELVSYASTTKETFTLNQYSLSGLKTSSPFEMELLKKWRCKRPDIIEARLHERFKEFRVRGEWFKLSADIIQSLLNLPDLNAEFPGETD
jgi:Meiotically up-regulated gene 113